MSGHYDVLLTMDRSIEFQQRISTLPFGIVLVHAPSNRMEHLRPLVPSILSALDAVKPGRICRVGSRTSGTEAIFSLIAKFFQHPELTGRRLRPQPRLRRRPDQGLRAEPIRVATVMSRPTDDRAIVDAGLRALAFELGSAARLRRARRHLRARLRRAQPPRRHQPPRDRQQNPPRFRPLRPDRQPLRLVRRRPRQPRRTTMADHRPRRGLLNPTQLLALRSARFTPPASRPCAGQRKKSLRIGRGSSAPRNIGRPSGWRWMDNDYR